MKINCILLIPAAALLLLACTKDPAFPDAGAITVEAGIGAMTKVTTDGAASSFEAGDKIAVYAWTGSAAAVPAERVVDGVVNTLGSNGKWTPASRMLWKVGSDAHYFLGVSPVRAISDFSADAFALTADEAANDLLFAKRLEGLTPGTTPVALTFDHAMAKLTVNLKVRNEFGASPTVSVSVTAKSGATVNYLTQAVTATGDASARSLTAAASAPTGYTHSFGGIQVPQEGVKTVTITIDGKDYIYEAGEDIPLKSGHHTTLGLIVGKDKIELSGVSVGDWAVGGSLPGGEAKVVSTFFANNWLTFTSEGTTTISLLNNDDNAPKLYYSFDKTNWTQWDYSELTFTSSAPLYLCGDNPGGFSLGVSKYSKFVADGSNYCVSGDIMSLLNKDDVIKVIPNKNCFKNLFEQSTILKTAPKLEATTLTYNCYELMFSGCTGLTAAPDLPATTLAENCYAGMFRDCTGLTAAPDLPATTLANGCYMSMFRDCTGLTAAPDLPATTLADDCYSELFKGCVKLNYVKCLATNIDAKYCTSDWLGNVSSSGTFVKAPEMDKWTLNIPSGIPFGWTVYEDITVSNYLTFTSEGTTTLSLLNIGDNAPVLYYSYDKTNWTKWNYSDLTFTSTDSLYLCGDNPGGFCTSVTQYSKFVGSGSKFSVSGDIMSLLSYDKDIKEIPCDYCFGHMFDRCKLLTKAPDLPATTLAPGCYFEMFHGCESLETAPILPATRLYNWSYAYMFQGCSNLNYVKCLAEDIIDTICTYYWLDAVKSSGTFTTPSLTAWSSGKSGIPDGWSRVNL